MNICDLSDIKHYLSRPSRCTVISHRNPDGDAIGSSLAMNSLLNKLGHASNVILPSDFPSVFSWLKGSKEIIVFDNNPNLAREQLKKSDLIIAVDFNTWDRVDPMQLQIHESEAKKIVIDHHLDPEPYFDAMYSFPEASSTCELVYNLIQELGEITRLDASMAEALYTGILTDTGSFDYALNPNLLRVSASLLEYGIDAYGIQNRIFNCFSVKNLSLLGHALCNRLQVIPELSTGIIHLNKDDYKDFKIRRGDTEGIVNYILKVEGVNLGVFITEQPSFVKLSLRSKGSFSVKDMASKHFNGGGHNNASGGMSKLSLDDTIAKIIRIASEHKNEIIKSI